MVTPRSKPVQVCTDEGKNSSPRSTDPLTTQGTSSSINTSAEQDTAPSERIEEPPLWQVIQESDSLDAPKPRIQREIQRYIDESELTDEYNILFLYDENNQINRYMSNRIYSAVTSLSKSKQKNLFLMIHNFGGRVEPAYLISKCCKNSARKFVAVVPRFAKSAATLISLGAAEIHMGIISELGPIDPQVGNYPALGLSAGIEAIVQLCKTHQDVADLLAKNLLSSLNLHDLGYLERVSASAVQYAERLLSDKKLPSTPTDLANKFVYGYKDHGFVIDRDEASHILGAEVVKFDTPEYQLANRLHEYFEQVNLFYAIFKDAYMTVLGDPIEGIGFRVNERR